MRLRPGLRVLRRSTTEVQVGTDPRWAVRLVDLTPAQVHALTSLDHTGDLRAPELAPLVGLLDEAGLTTRAAARRAPPSYQVRAYEGRRPTGRRPRGDEAQALPRMRLSLVPHTGQVAFAMRRPDSEMTTSPSASRFSKHFTQ